MEMTMNNLSTRDLIKALENSGYMDNAFTSSKFIKITKSGKAWYTVTFRDQEGELAAGDVFIEEQDGKFFGEF
jgi:hypothetical protein